MCSTTEFEFDGGDCKFEPIEVVCAKMNELEMKPVMKFVIVKILILIKETVNKPVIKNLKVMEYVIKNAIMKKITEIMETVNVIWLTKEMDPVMRRAIIKKINEMMETVSF